MADQDFIEKIRAAEASADQLRNDAREDATEKRKDARQKSERYVDQAYKDAQLERQEIMEAAEAKYREILAAVFTEAENEISDLSSPAVKQAANAVAERIVTLLGDF